MPSTLNAGRITARKRSDYLQGMQIKTSQPFIRNYLPGLAISLLGVIILFKDLWMAFPERVLWGDDFDVPLVYWIVNWGYHILFQMKDPAEFWHANSFYPHSFTLAYSESLLSLQLLFAPLRALGLEPLLALYGALALTVVICCLLTLMALQRVGYFSPMETAFIVFGAHFSLSVTSFLYHYQLFGFHFIPPFLMFLYLYLRDRRAVDFLAACLLFCLGVSYSIYLGPILVMYTLFLFFPFAVWRIWRTGIGQFIRPKNLIAYLIGGVLLVGLYFIQVRPYMLVANEFPKQPLSETMTYSATPFSIVNGVSPFSHWYEPAKQVYGFHESAYFPGVLLLLLASAYLLTLALQYISARIFQRPASSKHDQDATSQGSVALRKPEREFILILMLFLFLSLVFSCGPYLRWSYESEAVMRLPYYYLAKLIPGLDVLRAPGRFGMFIGLPLAVMSVLALRQFKFPSRRYGGVVLVTLLFVMVESIPAYKVYPFEPDPQGVYQWSARHIQPGTPLLELPLMGKDHFDTIRIATRQLVGSTVHWGKVLSGYGSKMPSTYLIFREADWKIQAGEEDLELMINLAQSYQIDQILIHLDQYPAPIRSQWKAFANRCGRTASYVYGKAILLQLDEPECR